MNLSSFYCYVLPSFIFQSLAQHNKNFTMVFIYPSGWKLTPTGVNEDWLQYTHSTSQTPATLQARTLLPHTGDYTTHISTYNSTSEGTPYHSKIESYTAPLKTDAKLHLSGPPSTAPHPCSSLPQHTHRSYLILKPARMQLLFYWYHVTHPGVNSPLPTINYIPGHYYLLVLPNFS